MVFLHKPDATLGEGVVPKLIAQYFGFVLMQALKGFNIITKVAAKRNPWQERHIRCALEVEVFGLQCPLITLNLIKEEIIQDSGKAE